MANEGQQNKDYLLIGCCKVFMTHIFNSSPSSAA